MRLKVPQVPDLPHDDRFYIARAERRRHVRAAKRADNLRRTLHGKFCGR